MDQVKIGVSKLSLDVRLDAQKEHVIDYVDDAKASHAQQQRSTTLIDGVTKRKAPSSHSASKGSSHPASKRIDHVANGDVPVTLFKANDRKRPIKLIARDTWAEEGKHQPEQDADTYSSTGLPPKKLIRRGSTLEIRDWKFTPCRYGANCKAHERHWCPFLHRTGEENEDQEEEVAAGSELRLRQIKSKLEKSESDALKLSEEDSV